MTKKYILLNEIRDIINELEKYKTENRRLKSIINGNDFFIYDSEKDVVIFNTDCQKFGGAEWMNKLAEFVAAKQKEEK